MHKRLAASQLIFLSLIALSPANAADMTEADTPKPDLAGFDLRTTISAAMGYETNPDSDVDPQGSAFYKNEIEAKLTKKTEDFSLEAKVRGETLKYVSSDEPFEWTAEASLTASKVISKATNVELEISREQEKTPAFNLVTTKARATLEHKTDIAEIRLRASIEHEDEVLDADDTDNEFDFFKPQAEARALFMPSAKISPYILVRTSLIHHPNQDGGTIDRNASDHSLIAGLRFKPYDKLSVDIGARYNLRSPKDRSIEKFHSAFVEASFDWEISDKLSLEGFVSRGNEEPERDFSIVNDTTEYEVRAKSKPMERLELEAAANYKTEDEIGGDRTDKKLTLEAAATYAFNDSFDIFAEVEQSWRTKTDTSTGEMEKTRNTIALVGTRAHF
jgi:opacity protein-like surface antigen